MLRLKKVFHPKKNTDIYARIDWDKVSHIFKDTPVKFSQNNKYPAVKDLLHLLVAAGSIGLMFVFPGAAPAIGSLALGENKYSRWSTKQVLAGMSQRKWVEIKYKSDGTVTVIVTNEGIRKALSYQVGEMAIKIPKKWDRKWRVVIFDIPEKYKNLRDIFRMRLRQLGLYTLQESVYVSPYPCFDEIEFLRELYGVAVTVKYMLVEKLEDDEAIRQNFSL